jgi:uncharacterized damage-inducible protein DinB
MTPSKLPEPWLRGTLTEVDPVLRAVLHALELAKEDLEKWCGDLTDAELDARPGGLEPVVFHLRHIARSIDRLLTYAENQPLSADQIARMELESEPGAKRAELFEEVNRSLDSAARRIRAFAAARFAEPRAVGRQSMPTTLAGLIVHVADHTQRHVGQAVTTAKLLKSCRQRQ